MSYYGYDRETTPNIDRIAEQGTAFERCFTTSTWTRPVAASLLTGLSPSVHRTTYKGLGYDPPVDPLPAQLRDVGYETVGFGTMPNMRGEIFGAGFDKFVDVYKENPVIEGRDDDLKFEDGTPVVRAGDLNRCFTRWLNERDDDRPFFALLWANDPHLPYSPPPDFDDYTGPNYDGPVTATPDPQNFDQSDAVETKEDQEELIGLYDGEIRYLDSCVGKLWNLLDEQGVLSETELLLCGDHGELFGEHGEWGHGPSMVPYEGLTHVPFIVYSPDDRMDGNRVDELASLVDIYPTILELAAQDACSETVETVQGRSLVGGMREEDIELRDAIYVEGHPEMEYGTDDAIYAVRTDQWKLVEFDWGNRDADHAKSIAKSLLSRKTVAKVVRKPMHYFNRHIKPLGAESSCRLYDLTSERGESEDVLKQQSDVVEELLAKLRAQQTDWAEMREKVDAKATATEVVDETTKQQLEQLGYGDLS